eukprot:jgi/Botrbrau1/6450/Bobra.0034s0025.1
MGPRHVCFPATSTPNFTVRPPSPLSLSRIKSEAYPNRTQGILQMRVRGFSFSLSTLPNFSHLS